MKNIITTDIELADVQQTASALAEKLEYYKANEPYAHYEISRMETALKVLDDLMIDLCEMD